MEHSEVSGSGKNITHDLATWVANSQVAEVPGEVLQKARLLVLDGIGCGLHGGTQEWAQIVAEYVLSTGGRGEAALWGTPHRVPGVMAPFANGTAMHAFEYDDLHPTAVLHAGAQVLPVAFAIAEMQKHRQSADAEMGIPSEEISGAEFLHAIVLGFEVGARIGLATGAGQLSRGFHPSPNTATFAAAATASRLLKIDAAQTAHAFGIAGSFGGYLMAAQYGAMVKRVHPGHSGQSGMTAALLASRGLTGTEAVLETPYGGFASTYADATSESLSSVTKGLGFTWEIPAFSFKYYPCCGSNHTSLDAWWALRERGNLQAQDIERVDVRCSTLTADHVGWAYSPGSVTTAQMNLSYCLAAAISDGRLTIDQFESNRLADPNILSLVERIHVQSDEAIDELGRARRHLVKLTITTRDGRTLEETCEFPKGSAGNPMDDAQVVAKFEGLAGRTLSGSQVSEIQRLVLSLGISSGEPFDVMAFTQMLIPEKQKSL